MKNIFLFFLIIFTVSSCKVYKPVFIGNMDFHENENTKKRNRFIYKKSTKEPLNYAPYPEREQWNYERVVKVNVHFMHDSTSNHNIPEEDVQHYAKYLVSLASERVQKNKQMNLPVGNNTPVLRPYYKYQLYPNNKEAVYIHHDNDLCFYVDKGKNKNNYSSKMIKKYGVNTDSILNIFVIPHHPDSIESKTYPGYSAGIALGTSLKISGNFHSSQPKAWEFSPILNHEVGHILGLGHAWNKSDGCDDTPVHNNCYYNSGVPPCDGPASNNMMDYNAEEVTLTPCQIGKIHRNFAGLKSKKRKLIKQDWCNLDTSRIITIGKDTEWNGSMDLSHSVIVQPGANLTINSRVSFPKGAYIEVSPDATLTLDQAHLHNACGDNWQGIILKSEKKSFIVYRNTVLIENVEENISSVK